MVRPTGLVAICAAFLLAPLVECAGADIAGLGGYGFTAGEDQRREGTLAYGASCALFAVGRHGVGFDYLYGNFRGATFDRHFLTMNYVLHLGRSRVRPFVRIGPGIVVTRWNFASRGGPNSGAETEFAAIAGFGVTIDAGRRFFIRPEVRSYLYTPDFPRRGTTITFLPALGIGWRF